MTDSVIKCVVAEDELLLRDALVSMLQEAGPQLEIVAVCEDGGSALEAIAAQRPQLALLHIRMPGLSGLEVASSVLELGVRTEIVFVTAYDQYAIEAFERGAVDYLLKPVTRERLTATLDRVRERLARGAPSPDQLGALLARLAALVPQAAPSAHPAAPLVWLTASRGNETRLILVDDVIYFQSDSKYTAVLTKDGEALLRTPLRDLLAVLDPAMFKQVHRSTVVNLRAVAGVTRDDSGKGVIRLRDRPETLSVSQPFMALFRNM